MPSICWEIRDLQIVWVRSIRFYHTILSFCERVAFDTKMNGKLAKCLGFNQISSSLNQFFPRSHVSARNISYVIPASSRSFPLLPPYRVMANRCENQSNSATAAGRDIHPRPDDSVASGDGKAPPPCVLWCGTVQLADASSQTWLLWEREEAQVLGRDWPRLSTIFIKRARKRKRRTSCVRFFGLK